MSDNNECLEKLVQWIDSQADEIIDRMLKEGSLKRKKK